MRSLEFAPWRIVLVVSVIVIAIPIGARVNPTAKAAFAEHHLIQPSVTKNTFARRSKANVSPGVSRRTQDYYDRRRKYWEDRVDRRFEELDEEESGGNDDKASEDKKDSKGANKEDTVDSEEELIERRREYWRDRLDREW